MTSEKGRLVIILYAVVYFQIWWQGKSQMKHCMFNQSKTAKIYLNNTLLPEIVYSFTKAYETFDLDE